MTAKGQNIATNAIQTKCHRLLENYKCGKKFPWTSSISVTNSKRTKETTSTAVGYNLEHCS